MTDTSLLHEWLEALLIGWSVFSTIGFLFLLTGRDRLSRDCARMRSRARELDRLSEGLQLEINELRWKMARMKKDGGAE